MQAQAACLSVQHHRTQREWVHQLQVCVGSSQSQRPAVVLQRFENLLARETERGVVQQFQHRALIRLEGAGFGGKRVCQLQRGAGNLKRRSIAQNAALSQGEGTPC